ncbi:MAG TPA: hypothetical protein VMX18_04675 [Candidatus Bipolaricaulota bacterium]|nr:hypothetical protein [Candidatus Bipolaricaulota bacterium]
MRLSKLQKYILIQSDQYKGERLHRDRLVEFYGHVQRAPKSDLQTKIISRSLESLIDKELMIGYGMRTPHKWFIKEIKLTSKGKKEAKKLLGEQMSLPLKTK